MEQKERKPVSYYIRALHRDVGFFVIGLVVIYTLSGIALVYRDTSFLLQDVQAEKQLATNLKPAELGKKLHLRGFSVTKTEGDMVYFQGGTYNKTTGLAVYTTKQRPFVLQKCITFHKIFSGKSSTHWGAVVFASLLCFLAISSFWMYPKSSRMFRRGIYIAIAGIIVSMIILFV